MNILNEIMYFNSKYKADRIKIRKWICDRVNKAARVHVGDFMSWRWNVPLGQAEQKSRNNNDNETTIVMVAERKRDAALWRVNKPPIRLEIRLEMESPKNN